jgi:hypothetical protein
MKIIYHENSSSYFDFAVDGTPCRFIYIGFFLFFFIADIIGAWMHQIHTPTATKDIVMLSLIFITLFSYVLAWKKELFGGSIGLAAYLINASFNHQMLHRVFWIAPVIGLLFIVTALLDRQNKKH